MHTRTVPRMRTNHQHQSIIRMGTLTPPLQHRDNCAGLVIFDRKNAFILPEKYMKRVFVLAVTRFMRPRSHFSDDKIVL